MNRTQRFFRWLLGPGVERESREWIAQCSHCGHRESVWDMGGIRYKATGNPSVTGMCNGCGSRSRRRLTRSP